MIIFWNNLKILNHTVIAKALLK